MLFLSAGCNFVNTVIIQFIVRKKSTNYLFFFLTDIKAKVKFKLFNPNYPTWST